MSERPWRALEVSDTDEEQDAKIAAFEKLCDMNEEMAEAILAFDGRSFTAIWNVQDKLNALLKVLTD